MKKPFRHIATGIAFSPNLEANIRESLRITQQVGEKLFLVHAGEVSDSQKVDLDKILGDAQAGDEVEVIFESGDPVEALTRAAQKHEVDLLIAGALPKEKLLRYFFKGSTARNLVRRAQCSVLLLTKANKMQTDCGKIVVNGLAHGKTERTIKKAVQMANCLKTRELSIIEEVPPKAIGRIEDDRSLKKAAAKKEEIRSSEQSRIQQILEQTEPAEHLKISQNVIFGKKGYTIGHYAQTAQADLLIMNSPDSKLGLIERFFAHDLEYILSELPCDLLIINEESNN